MASLSCIRKNSKPWQGGKSMLDTVKKVRMCSRHISPASFLLTGWENIGQQQQVCVHFVCAGMLKRTKKKRAEYLTTLTYMLCLLFNISSVMKSRLPFLTGDHCWQLVKACNIHELQREQRFTDMEWKWVGCRTGKCFFWPLMTIRILHLLCLMALTLFMVLNKE